MRIKHFSGYGSVNAVKVESKKFTDDFGNQLTKLLIRVTGDHERGLELPYETSAVNWLLTKHFAKEVNYTKVKTFNVNSYYDKNNNEVCDYTFVF